MAVILSKLSRPDTSDALVRNRLFSQLDSACTKPIIWISAPAGAGKTTLISSYIDSRGFNELWYQVDEGDADMATFFHYLGIAVKASTRTRKKMPALTPEFQFGIPEFTRNYFRELFSRFKSPGLLVLDNFQDAGQESILHKVLPEALQEIPKGINVIIISRAEPSEPYARLRVNQDLTQINWSDLQFTIDEELAVTQKRYPKRCITKPQLENAHKYIQGWVTGLILLLERGGDLNDVSFDGDELRQEYLFDYFSSEIFHKIDSEQQKFLLETSFLPKMNASLCKKLTGNARSKNILSELTRKQYFTVRHGLLNPHYEYHPLFLEFLQNLAREILSDDELIKTQNAAGILLAESGDVDFAVRLLEAAKNWDALAELLLKNAKNQIEHGRNRKIIQWIELLPDEIVESKPWLTYWLGIGMLQYENEEARIHFEKAYSLFTVSEDVKGLYLSWCGVADSYVFANASFVGATHWIRVLDKLQATYSKPLSLEIRGHLAFSAAGLLLWAEPTNPDLHVWHEKIELMYKLIPNRSITIMCAAQLGFYYSNIGSIDKARYLNKKLKSMDLLNKDITFLSSLVFVTLVVFDLVLLELKLDEEYINNYYKRSKSKGLRVFSGLLISLQMYRAESMRDMAWLESQIELHQKEISDGNILEQGHYNLHLCNLEILRVNFDKALRYNLTAASLVDKAQAPLPQWITYATQAYVYAENNKFDLAKRSLDFVGSTEQGMKSHALTCVTNMIYSFISLQQGDEDAAIKYLKSSFRLGYEKEIKSYSVWPARMIATLCAFALENDIEPIYAKSLIKIYRYTLNDSLYKTEYWPIPIKIYCHGRFGVLLNDKSIKIESRPFELLKVLIAFGGRDVREESIMDALWPDAEGDQARTNFKITLHRLRQEFSDLDVLILKNHQLSLNEQLVWVDTWVVARIFGTVESCLGSNDIPQSIVLINKILTHYRGHFMGKEVSSWVIQHREAMRFRYIRHCITLAQLIETENTQLAITCYQHILEIDSLVELAYQGMIRCYLSQGQQAEALRTYQRCVDILAATSDVPPSDVTKNLLKNTIDLEPKK